jgi:RNA polymerase sigma-70 factor (ECF subfamily)
MTKDMWSWVMISKESFPIISGEVKYLKDNRTCVAPVNLEPGKTYAIWFNSEKYNAFRDTYNNPAVPYLLVFQTKE